jgi:glycogen synthase
MANKMPYQIGDALRVAMTGDAFFWRRYKNLAPALAKHVGNVDILPSGNILELLQFRFLNRAARGPLARPIQNYLRSFDRKAEGFAIRSRQTERKLRRAAPADYVLHLFSSFAPAWTTKRRFGMYLDYTMAQAARDWPAWAAFESQSELSRWLAVEKRAYEQAETIFTMGASTAMAVIADYGIPEGKVRVVGSASDFDQPFRGTRSFGSQVILFQGSEFERKGGDVLLDAFAKVRASLPSASLTIIGTDRPIQDIGVSVLGIVPPTKVRELLLQADVVAAPARCDPFTAFVIEAMNYGTPSVVTRTSGISEQIKGGGLVLERLDAELLAEALIALLTDQKRLKTMSESARQVIADTLNWNAVAAKIAERI